MKILLADDYAPLRSTLRLWLEQEPTLRLVGEVDEVAALLAQAHSTQPDVILLDWELPGLQPDNAHKQLIAALYNQLPALHLVAMSTRPEVEQQALAAGAEAFVSKNEPPGLLLALLRTFY